MLGQTVSHYRITRELGAGGMGVVYEAVDTRLDRTVALKFLPAAATGDPRAKARFIREAKAASALDHPNVCTVYEAGETAGGRLFIAMACCEGETLRDRLERGPLAVDAAVEITWQVAAALAAAHERDLVHRDIKPANIFLTDNGLVKVLDFGLAKFSGQTMLTRSGTAPGTIGYMAPEQARGQAVDRRTDLWALGVVLYEMVTGRRPFVADYEQAVIYAILNTEPPPPHELDPRVPEALSDLIVRCLAKDPARRQQSVAALREDLAAVARAEGWEGACGRTVTPVPAPGTARVARGRAVRWRYVPGAALAALVAVLVWRGTRPPPLYTTELRLAALPLVNQAHPAQDAVTAGMSEVVHRSLDDASRLHDSMWVVPSRLVRYAALARDDQARGAFGVNRIVTGGLQRFGGGLVLLLELRDAASLRQLEAVRVPYDPQTGALADSLPGAVARLSGLDPARTGDLPPCLPADGPAATRYLEGLGALEGGDQAAAVAALGPVTAAVPDFAPGWCDLGTALALEQAAAGDPEAAERALASLQRAVELAPGLWRPRAQLGDLLRRAGDGPGALAAFRAAEERDPGNAVACAGRSRVLRAEGRLAEAEAALRAAIGRRPDYFEAARLLALHFYRTGDEAACLVQLDRTLALAPDDAYALNTKGAVLVGRGDFTGARELFERAFALLPNCDTCSNIGLMLYHEGQFRESASFYELSLEYCGQDDPQVWANWARALYWTDGGRPEAASRFRTAIELTRQRRDRSPGDTALLGNLIEYHAMIGDEEAARRLIAAADSLAAADGEILYQIGDAYELLGDRIAALRYLAAAMHRGIPVQRILDTRELEDLVADERFVRLAAAAAGARPDRADSAR